MANLKDLYELGFGRVTAFSIIENSPKSLFATILVANMPQGILSFLYLLYNGMFSSVLGAYEWSLFGKHRQPLRVTSPKGQQRSTFFLHLPYRYAIVSSQSLRILRHQLTDFLSHSSFFRAVYIGAYLNLYSLLVLLSPRSMVKLHTVHYLSLL